MDKLFPTRYSQTTQVKAFAGTGGATHSIKDFRLTSYPKLVCYHPMCLALVRPLSLVSNEYYTQPRDFHVDLRLPVGYAER